ncbi:response regulator [Blastococcus saxobsidens]|uniref:Response regulator with CheY-like receiver domain and winged-helix DNA-binding domain n=1 Tax=Blastococcus saxobsidens (strain DD2) TaxID=1146883 RepID=H6RW60_BLASD|nr:response regulator [Blastococcus saxobsidens]CCG02077.1 Response regulator with CheY-like receiver domain and winged-helix DNA-binding domain [Blastococcus saxobsidens DD2]
MLTALVVDSDPTARDQVSDLLCLGGWQVQQATGPEDAVRHALIADVDLVVTDTQLPGGSGTEMLRRMRRNGSRARFVVVTTDLTAEIRFEAASAGALITLATPVTARALLDFLRSRTTGPAAQAGPPGTAGQDVELLDVELMTRLQAIYADALQDRLSAIDWHTRAGNATAVASAAQTLAGTSGQLGHPEVASVCQAIAADARRGVLAHSRVADLHELTRVS